MLQRITEEFNPAQEAFTASDREISVEPDSLSEVRITTYNANQITLEISRNNPGFLVLGEIWYPQGWEITLNGEETEMIRTNYILRGFEIPAGDHVLEMKMKPVWYSAGRLMSQLGTILLFGTGAMGLFLLFRKPGEEADTGNE